MPVRAPLPVQLPEAVAAQLQAAAAQQAAALHAKQSTGEIPRQAPPGSAMQQLRTTMGGA
jgi:hypothetical protein